jgi:hypothetical protein
MMMTLKKDMILLDWRVARGLRLVLSLIDGFTGRTPIGDIRLSINDQTIKVSKNLSGDYLFSNVTGDMVHIRVESDYYFAPEKEITISPPDQKPPVETLELQPTPCYPFPGGTTLIRGMVKDSQGNLLSGAKVSTAVPTFSTLTTARGEFVCYYTGLRDEDIVIIDGKRFLKGKKDNTISLPVTYDTLGGGVDLTDVPEGEVRVLALPIILNKAQKTKK